MFEALDPEQVEEILQPIMGISGEVISAHGGLITQFRGDEIIALFGGAVSENDARDAVQAALELHERVRAFSGRGFTKLGKELTMHSGISTGLVVIRPDDKQPGLFGVFGDAVNMAARLVTLAAPNEILVTSDTMRWIEPFFKLEQLAPVSVKGKSDLVTPYRVVSAYAERSSFEGRMLRGVAPFVGRGDELAHLRRCLASACNGHGQVVAISAQAGMGKSRLLHEFIRGLPDEGLSVLVARCAVTDVDVPYHPWIDIVRQLLQVDIGQSAEARLAQVLESARELELDIERHVPALCHLLAVSTAEYVLPPTFDGPARAQMLWQAMSAVIRRSASRAPLIFALEDWQWADSGSDRFLRHHLSGVSSLPILVVVTFRADSELSWPVLGHVTALALEPLNPSAIAEMASAMFELASVPEWVILLLQDRTGGNPLFVEETIRALREDQAISAANGNIASDQKLPTLGIPDSIHSAVLGRLDRLRAEWRETLRRAAVIGREFPLSILSKLLGADLDAEQIMWELEELGFVILIEEKPHPVFAFKHVIIQNVVYETLLLKQRKELHSLVGRVIEEVSGGRPEEYCESLAYHYSRGDNIEQAVKYLELAGDRAAQSYALDAARNQFIAAIRVLTEEVQNEALRRKRIEITLKWAAVSQFATSDEHVDVMRRALSDATLLNDTRLIINCNYWLGRMYYGRGNPNAAIAEFETVLANKESLEDDQLLGRTFCVLGRISLFTADASRGIEYLERGIEIMQGCGELGDVAYSISSHGCIRAFIGEFLHAERLFDEALLQAREKKDRANEALVLQQLSYARCLRGDWSGAIDAAGNCLQIAKTTGVPVLASFAEIFQAYARWMSGNRDKGYQDITDAIQRYQSGGHRLAGSICHGWCAEVCALQHDYTRGRTHAELSIDREKQGDRFGQLAAQRALIHIAKQSGNVGEVNNRLRQALDIGKAQGAVADLGITHFYAAELLSELGDAKKGARHRAEAMRIFAAANMPWWESRAGAGNRAQPN
jgi:class 3 adenylate cyclase/tetratricopeptide (TPR) repeat protein